MAKQIRLNNEITKIGDALELLGQLIRRRAEFEDHILTFEGFQSTAIKASDPAKAQEWEFKIRSERSAIRSVEVEIEKLLPIAQVFLAPTALARITASGRDKVFSSAAL
jgi:hypothetical protein